jgi:hypothetical protein
LARDLSGEDCDLIDHIMIEKVSCIAEDRKAKHCKKVHNLHKAQHPQLPPDNRKTVINLSKVSFEEAACSILSKGLNYAVTLAVVPVEDILRGGVEKAIGALPEETAEEVRQETIKILKGSRKPKANLTGAEMRALWALKALTRCSLEAYCEHHWCPHLLLGRTPSWATGLPYWQLSTPCKELDRLYPRIGFYPHRFPGYNSQVRCGIALHQGAD